MWSIYRSSWNPLLLNNLHISIYLRTGFGLGLLTCDSSDRLIPVQLMFDSEYSAIKAVMSNVRRHTMKNKLAAILLAALVASGTLAGCGSSVSGTAQSVAANESATVASADVSTEEKAESFAEDPESESSAAETDSEKSSEGTDSRIADASEMTEVETVVEDWMVPIGVDSLVEGTYPVTVASSSSMFSIESAELTVKEDHMYAALTMKGTGYLYLFMGTPEEAVNAGEKEYLPFAENADGVHTFTIPVEALDKGIDCAAFSKRKEKWYARTLVVRSDSLPISAWKDDALTTAADLGLSDGEYAVNVTLAGGSGKASVQSPASLRIEGDAATATIIWGSSNYDYMIVDGTRYDPVTLEGGSTFEIPVTVFDRPMKVTADTTAMSKPYEIEYTLTFESDTIE